MAHLEQGSGRGAAGSPGEHAECAKPSRGENSTNSLERKIRHLEKQRKELLDVNQQWDQQFRSMKELYETKVAELKAKLEAAERFLSTLEKKLPLPPSQKEGDSPRDPAPEQQQRQEKGQESLNRELHELKKENKLLKENNALVSRKKEHYECEIRRLNKALQEALGRECSPLPEDRLGRPEKGCSREEMRTEMEVLKQQVQIYEEDFHRERSDRERLNREKEELQQINQTSQSQLNKLKSQMKACQMEKEQLEKQLTQMHLPTCRCSLGSHLRDPCAPTGPGAEQNPQQQHPRKPPGLLLRGNGIREERLYTLSLGEAGQTVRAALPTRFRQMCSAGRRNLLSFRRRVSRVSWARSGLCRQGYNHNPSLFTCRQKSAMYLLNVSCDTPLRP
ncbi:LOW QUALITY PROTEIN: TNFAIP3-interacting protein 3 [Molossus nigricans]